MKTPKTIDVSVSRLIQATPDEVFDVWLDASSPGGPWFGAEKVILNPVVDGLYYHAVRWEGRVWSHYGRFITVERGRRLEHTWMSQATQGLETMVTITFEARGDKTQLELRHTGIPDDELGHSHQSGWNMIVGAVEERFAKRR